MNKQDVLEELKKPQNLTNTPKAFLKVLDAQRAFLLKLALLTPPCPWPECKKPVSQIDAAGPGWTLEDGDSDSSFTCPHCGKGLQRIIPLISTAPWYWYPR